MAKSRYDEIFPFRSPVRWPLWMAISVVLSALMIYFYFTYPQAAIGPEQPVPFSHRVHAGVKRINCLFCHPYAAGGQRAGLPVMAKCFFCHDYVIPLHPQIQKEREHYKSGRPVRWVRIFYVPDYVKFRHHPHVSWAGLGCDTCHGPVQQMDRLEQRWFKMGFCISCHRRMDAQLECWLTCHR